MRFFIPRAIYNNNNLIIYKSIDIFPKNDCKLIFLKSPYESKIHKINKLEDKKSHEIFFLSNFFYRI
jgi:hypothetical protein